MEIVNPDVRLCSNIISHYSVTNCISLIIETSKKILRCPIAYRITFFNVIVWINILWPDKYTVNLKYMVNLKFAGPIIFSFRRACTTSMDLNVV